MDQLEPFFTNGFDTEWTLQNEGNETQQGWAVSPGVEGGEYTVQGCYRWDDLVSVTTLGLDAFTQRVEKTMGDTLAWTELAQSADNTAKVSIGTEHVAVLPGTPYRNTSGGELGNEACSVHIERLLSTLPHAPLLQVFGNAHVFASGAFGYSFGMKQHQAQATLGVLNSFDTQGLHFCVSALDGGGLGSRVAFLGVSPRLPLRIAGKELGVTYGVKGTFPLGEEGNGPALSVAAETAPTENTSIKVKVDRVGLALSATLKNFQNNVTSFTPNVRFSHSGDILIGCLLTTSI